MHSPSTLIADTDPLLLRATKAGLDHWEIKDNLATHPCLQFEKRLLDVLKRGSAIVIIDQQGQNMWAYKAGSYDTSCDADHDGPLDTLVSFADFRIYTPSGDLLKELSAEAKMYRSTLLMLPLNQIRSPLIIRESRAILSRNRQSKNPHVDPVGIDDELLRIRRKLFNEHMQL